MKKFKLKIDLVYIVILSAFLFIYSCFIYILTSDNIRKAIDDMVKGYVFVKLFIPILIAATLLYLVWRAIVRHIMKPVKKIAEIAEQITHEDLSARVDIKQTGAETKYLISSFNDMISRLESSFKYIVESNSYIAHELKTPIAIIRGEAEIALKKERDNEEYKKVIGIALDESKKMLKTIEDLLLLTKMTYRPEFLNFEAIDLSQFLNDIHEQSKILTVEKNISVDINVPEVSERIKGDEISLRRLFFNIIDNAIKFTPQNGQIKINIKYKKRKAIVSISDTGMGIAEKDIPKLFDKFFRANKEKNRYTSGSGLGLPIAQSIAELHKANITVNSTLGKGSTFIVTLPILPH
ncbi:MAG: ATP-binding protein [Candidatus Omnitrophota bacterium]|jgi:signal transduction histidine kinase